jgi:hypothetical protein
VRYLSNLWLSHIVPAPAKTRLISCSLRTRGALCVFAVLLLAACDKAVEKTNSDTWSPPTPEQDTETSYRLAEGTWGWARGDSVCQANTHTISFTPDRRTMKLVQNTLDDTSSAPRETSYEVLSAGPGKFLDFRHVIRGAIVGESRRTTTDDKVVWDLVLVTPNRYHWHRTDWPDDGMTIAILRCKDGKPIENWVSPVVDSTGPRLNR